jgi:integrase
MRQGSVFKRCTSCGAKVSERRCSRCRAERFTWSYVVDLSPPGMPRQQRMKGGFRTKAEALASMNELQGQKAAGTYVEPIKLTVGEYLTDWLAAGCGDEVRPWTHRGYGVIVRVHVLPKIGSIPLQRLTTDNLKALYRELRASGYMKGPTAEQRERFADVANRYRKAVDEGVRSPVRTLAQELGRPEATVRHWVRRCRELGFLGSGHEAMGEAGPRGLSRKSVHNVHIALRAALNDAVERGLLRNNPARKALRPPGRRRVMRTWTVEELRAFLESVKTERNFALYRVAAQTGMRRGELLGLTWSDVKFHSNSISIQQQWTGLEADDDELDELEDLSPTKTDAGRRAISLEPITVQALHEHRRAQGLERRGWGPGYQDMDLVFCRPDGTPHDPDSISGEFVRLVRRARLRRIRLHDLRHTHATLLLEAGVDITVVSKRLGHASVKTTADLYAHVTARLQGDAAERIGALVDGIRDVREHPINIDPEGEHPKPGGLASRPQALGPRQGTGEASVTGLRRRDRRHRGVRRSAALRRTRRGRRGRDG